MFIFPSYSIESGYPVRQEQLILDFNLTPRNLIINLITGCLLYLASTLTEINLLQQNYRSTSFETSTITHKNVFCIYLCYSCWYLGTNKSLENISVTQIHHLVAVLGLCVWYIIVKLWKLFTVCSLTHCGLMILIAVIGLGQHWFR